ncbi:MAG: HAD hydrolase family protein [Pseudotabrizicola sp.]|uniref:HAD hydrolase family protein n=1 Tax=Pseudotabrizicola sp. TaxID=2939647 RepID=UPI002ACDD489|nr:HAD hydrolase family protein [Pseudotabrizicola sp.]MDZ7575803.1 HAD hydrolase family protein [Pseudotabrizicola sp.]
MTRFAEKLDTLMRTVELVAKADLKLLASVLRFGQSRPTVAIGSGGSAISAHYFARCRETLFGQATEVVTPVEFVLSNRGLAGHDVWLFSASAENADSVASVVAALARAAELRVVTRNAGGAAAQAARARPGSHVFEIPVADAKDGFLATHSLVGSVIALLLASDLASVDPIGSGLVPQLLRDLATVLSPAAREAMAARFVGLGQRDLLLVIADPCVRAIAELIETSAWESAIAPVQLTDVRNFAHGRHTWLHHRSAETFVVALTSHETRPLWQLATAIFPDVRVTSLDFGDGGRFHNAVGIVQGLSVVEAMGRSVGIDPGKPGIGEFGRMLYDDSGLLEITRGLDPATRHKRSALLAGDSIDSADLSIASTAAVRRQTLAVAKIAGLVLDYDGTMITDAERYDLPRKEIVEELVRLDSLGVRLAIATGRGGSGGHALRSALPEALHPRVTIGYYNGAYVQPLTVDIEESPPSVDEALAATFSWLQSRPELFSVAFRGRFSNVQISIKLEDLAERETFFAALQGCPPIETGNVRFALSGHSVDFFSAKTSKRSVVERVREEIDEDSSVLCVGDSGSRSGNDHELLSHAMGVSVGTVCGRREGCWTLFGDESSGPDALLRILRALRRDVHGVVRMDMGALGLDSLVK